MRVVWSCACGSVAYARADGVPIRPRSLRPEHQRITQTMTTFQKIVPGKQPNSIFYPPSTCQC